MLFIRKQRIYVDFGWVIVKILLTIQLWILREGGVKFLDFIPLCSPVGQLVFWGI